MPAILNGICYTCTVITSHKGGLQVTAYNVIMSIILMMTVVTKI